MRLRTMALVAGALGIVVLAVGLVADVNRPARAVTADVPVETTVVVIEPQVLALAPEGRVGVTGSGALEAHVARPADARAWLGDYSATYVTGLADWETLTTRKADRVVAEPAVSPSPSASASASPSTSPSPATGAETEAGTEEAEPAPEPEFVSASRDHWRDTWFGTDRLSVSIADVPAGLPLIVTSVSGEPLSQADMLIDREVNDGWITPLIWWGAILTLLGFVALVFYIVDLRPVQARLETWMANRRRRKDAAEPAPGGRRARRTDTAGIPVVESDPETIDEEASQADDESTAQSPSTTDDEPTSKKKERP